MFSGRYLESRHFLGDLKFIYVIFEEKHPNQDALLQEKFKCMVLRKTVYNQFEAISEKDKTWSSFTSHQL